MLYTRVPVYKMTVFMVQIQLLKRKTNDDVPIRAKPNTINYCNNILYYTLPIVYIILLYNIVYSCL